MHNWIVELCLWASVWRRKIEVDIRFELSQLGAATILATVDLLRLVENCFLYGNFSMCLKIWEKMQFKWKSWWISSTKSRRFAAFFFFILFVAIQLKSNSIEFGIVVTLISFMPSWTLKNKRGFCIVVCINIHSTHILCFFFLSDTSSLTAYVTLFSFAN